MDEKVNPRPADADAAYNFLHEHNIDLSSVDEKALLRKIDWMIVPLMWACYNLQYVDKVLSKFSITMEVFRSFTNGLYSQFCIHHGPSRRRPLRYRSIFPSWASVLCFLSFLRASHWISYAEASNSKVPRGESLVFPGVWSIRIFSSNLSIVILWGTVVALNCAAKNFAGLLVLRLLLGCFEASVAPRYRVLSITF